MQQRAIGPNDILTFEDGRWEVVSGADNVFALRNIGTGAMKNMSLSEISKQMKAPLLFDRSLAETGKLEAGGQNERERLRLWVSRVQEIIYGKPDGADHYRPGYVPELTNQGQRLELMVRQLNDAGIDARKRTLERYVAEYKKHGPAGILDKRTIKKHHPLDNVPNAVLACIDAMIDDRMNKSSISLEAQATKVLLLIQELPTRDFPMPGRDRLIAAIKEKTKGRELSGGAKLRRTASNAPDWTFQGLTAIMPGSEVQIDSSRYDVRARKPDGTIGSFTLTVMMDKATRTILALSVQASGTGADHAYLLAQAMTPAEARPGSEELFNPWVLKGKGLPWAALLDDEEAARWETRRPIIRIFRIVTDNGRDFRSLVFESACRQLGIIITRCATASPTDKGMVERFFETLMEQFICHLPGFTGGDVKRRGKDTDAEGILDIENLIILLNRWIVQVWQNQPLDALRDPLHPSAKPVSPNVMYASMFPFVGHVPLALAVDDYISLLPVDHRTLQKDGIEFNCRQYDSDDLAELRMHTSGDSKLGKDGGEWEIHFRPSDPRQIWTYVPTQDRYITCYLKESRFDDPHRSGYWRIAEEMLKEGYVIPGAQVSEISGSYIKREVDRMRREEKRQAAANLAEHLAEVQNMGGPATRTDLTPEAGPDDDDDWEDVESYPMNPFIVERDSDGGDAE